MKRLEEFIDRYENMPLGLGLGLAVALFIIFVRDGVECLISTGGFAVPDGFHLIHVPVFFLSLLLSITVIVHFFSKVPIIRVSKIALVFFPVIIFPVGLDFIVTRFTGASVTYRYISENLQANFLHFFDPSYRIPEIPPSLRIEIGLISVLAFSYVFLKRRKFLPAAGAGFAVFLMTCFYVFIPTLLTETLKALASLIGFLRLEHFPFSEGVVDEPLITLVELTIAAFFGLLWLGRFDPGMRRSLVRKIPWAPFVFFCLWCLAGAAFSWKNEPPKDIFGLFRVATMLLAIFFSCLSGALDGREPLNIRGIALALGLLFSYSVNEACVLLVLLFIAFSFFHARLGRNLALSGLIFAFQAWLVFETGALALRPAFNAPLYPLPVLFWTIPLGYSAFLLFNKRGFFSKISAS